MPNIQEIILNKIKAGEVAMIPRWRFVLMGVLWALGGIISLLVAIYLASFVFFVLHTTGVVFTPGFGMRGIVFLVIRSPWLLILATMLFVGILYVLVRRFSFSYRKPVVYSLVATVLGVLIVSTMIHMLAVHAQVRSFSERHNIPGVSGMYRTYPQRPEGVYAGVVAVLTKEGFMLQTDKQHTLEVVVTKRTKQPGTELAVGVPVLVFGEIGATDGVVTAYGVRVVPESFLERPPRPGDGLMMDGQDSTRE